MVVRWSYKACRCSLSNRPIGQNSQARKKQIDSQLMVLCYVFSAANDQDSFAESAMVEFADLESADSGSSVADLKFVDSAVMKKSVRWQGKSADLMSVDDQFWCQPVEAVEFFHLWHVSSWVALWPGEAEELTSSTEFISSIARREYVTCVISANVLWIWQLHWRFRLYRPVDSFISCAMTQIVVKEYFMDKTEPGPMDRNTFVDWWRQKKMKAWHGAWPQDDDNSEHHKLRGDPYHRDEQQQDRCSTATVPPWGPVLGGHAWRRWGLVDYDKVMGKACSKLTTTCAGIWPTVFDKSCHRLWIHHGIILFTDHKESFIRWKIGRYLLLWRGQLI